MTDTTIDAAGPLGTTVAVAAWVDPQWPGLAIHKTVLLKSGWDITHVPSGLRICNLPSEAKARATLPLIGALADWNRPVDKLFLEYDPTTRLYDPANATVRLWAVKQRILGIEKATRKRKG